MAFEIWDELSTFDWCDLRRMYGLPQPPLSPIATALPWRIASRLKHAMPPPLLVGPPSEHPCLLWVGKWTTGNGYGKVSWEGRDRVAHRVIFEIFNGPLSKYTVLDHLCERRECCQPYHLDPVTVRENTYRGRAVLFRGKN